MALSDNIWWTRKARIQTEKRLLSNAFQSQLILLWYSFFSVAISIYSLTNSQDSKNSVLWVVYSVLVLCISGFINGLSFKERASLVKECYESLNSLIHSANRDGANQAEIAREYESRLNACENHTDVDFALALCQEYWASSKRTRKSSKEYHSKTDQQPPSPGILTRIPTSHHWFLATSYLLKRTLMLLSLYSLPIFLQLALSYCL